jgi:hypothetical protein
MAICAVFELPGMTQEHYEEGTRQVNGGRPLRSLSDWPVPGLLSHVAGPTPDGWFVVDVWESEDALQRFGEILGPVMEKMGFGPITPRIVPVHNIVVQ